ncbi:glucose 1-dehydrogenase [Pyxidicoccus fallax]|uniref:Glucose 1-dehydrogenase n=1 Tax=Pyxidicoccus fallax TaxID=394095 RepID=A0A848M188_9BACT|nr:glucose 1-dehydrogenase [Pyxidicoccus fallax]NMO23134.1 glucose 1-dehydrogenase [Pyxidicoccus fallax]NPC85788.1 glucose 1-dehydrogenase [Pyxidicoccus fallax]
MADTKGSRTFQDKVVLITGAGSGMGRAAALAFAREGASVVLAGRRHAELDAVAREVETAGGRALAVPTDVAKEAEVERLVRTTLERFDRLDAAFNNAGVEGVFAPIHELKAQDFDHTFDINVRGVWLSMKYQVDAMLRSGRGGAIVNNSSWLAHGALPGTSIYAASKAALDGMIRAVALEVMDRGVRVNNVNPGVIDTPMLRRLSTEETQRPFIAHAPARRLGTSEEVADVVLWLCSDGARFVTGQNLLVDGGYAIPGHRPWAAEALSPTASKR